MCFESVPPFFAIANFTSNDLTTMQAETSQFRKHDQFCNAATATLLVLYTSDWSSHLKLDCYQCPSLFCKVRQAKLSTLRPT